MILTLLFLAVTVFTFGLGYYLGHQIGGTAHIRSNLNTSRSVQLTTDHQGQVLD